MPIRLCGIFIFCSIWLSAQTKINLRYQSMLPDFGAAKHTRPVEVGTSLPATCSVGEMFFKSDAAAGQNLFGCAATNVWAALGGGSGAGGCEFESPGSLHCSGNITAGDGGNAGKLSLFEKSVHGSAAVSVTAPDEVAESYTLRLPQSGATGLQMLVFETSQPGNMTGRWEQAPVWQSAWYAAAQQGVSGTWTTGAGWTVPGADMGAAPEGHSGATFSAGYLRFPAGSRRYAGLTTLLPQDWQGSLMVTLSWSAGLSGLMKWEVAAACSGDGESLTDPVFNPAAVRSQTAAGGSGARNRAVFTALQLTGCSAGKHLHLRVARAGDSDGIPAEARLYGIELAFRRPL